ncbi:MAG: hypothetical protein HHJ17_06370 [Rhodoferax sp.]|nr:hypothetical protein [Rhodoferax sp.]
MVRAALALAFCSSGWALASEAVSNESMQSEARAGEVFVELEVPAATVAVTSFGTPVASSQLEAYRGGFDLVKNDMQLSGTVANNSAFNVMTGSNSIADGSFTNSSGFPMVIQNSGSNVLIQNATIINLQYQ